MLHAATVVAAVPFEDTNRYVLKRVGGYVEMFSNRKARRIVANASQVLTETFVEAPPGLTDV